MMTENQILNQLKRTQGETNERLDAILGQLKRTNELLYWLAKQADLQPNSSTAK